MTPLQDLPQIPQTTFAAPSMAAIPIQESESIASLAHKSIFLADADVRAQLLANIILVGPGTLIPGMADRLTWELNQLAPGVCILFLLIK